MVVTPQRNRAAVTHAQASERHRGHVRRQTVPQTGSLGCHPSREGHFHGALFRWSLAGGTHSSFGCSVNLPLGSRSADPHSTAVCCGNLLHSSPQPHTAGVVLHLTRWSTCYCNQDLRQETLKPGATPAGTAISHVHSTCQCSACCCHSGSGL